MRHTSGCWASRSRRQFFALAAILAYADIEKAKSDGYRGFDDPGGAIVYYVNARRSWREGQRPNSEKPGALPFLGEGSGPDGRAPEPTFELVGTLFVADGAPVDEMNARVPFSHAMRHAHQHLHAPPHLAPPKVSPEGGALYSAGSPTDPRRVRCGRRQSLDYHGLGERIVSSPRVPYMMG